MATPLTAVLLENAPLYDSVPADLEPRLQELVNAARASHPTVTLPEADFVAYLAARLPADATLPSALGAVHAEDLYLACGCWHGDEAALSDFDQHMLMGLDRVLSRLSREAAFVDEVRQALRTKLLVADGGPPRIGDYSGRGSLQGWVRSAATRLALDALGRQQPRVACNDDDYDARLATPDPELDYIKVRYRDDFKRAFRTALGTLPLEQRNALRLHHLDGLTLAQIAKLNNVHESTASRWLAAARAAVLEEIRRALSEQLGLHRDEVDSMMRLARSRLEISLHSLLR
jgi:RNA polymerase sigma-70 factor (ECF subfamily)